MNYHISDEGRIMLDSILQFFELDETVQIKKCLRASNAEKDFQNIPVNLFADQIKDFLIQNEFARNVAGGAAIKAKGMALKQAGSLFNFQKVNLLVHDVVVIDDDSINNLVCSHIIRTAMPEATIKTFIDPNAGLRYLYDTYSHAPGQEAIILLDINMPTLMGWDVLDEITTFPDAIKNKFKIFMLTSSVNPRDKEKAYSLPILWGYIEKPLTVVKMNELL